MRMLIHFVLIVASAWSGISLAENLAAPQYPASFMWPLKPNSEPPTKRVFMSRDTPEKVIAYYQAKYGPPETATFFRTMTSEALRQLLGGRIMGRETTVGVWIRPDRSPVPRQDSMAFGGLDYSVSMGHHTKAQADAVKKQYAHLDTAIYPPEWAVGISSSDEPVNRGVMQWCQSQQAGDSGGNSLEALQPKIEAAAQRGDMQEMQRLAQQAENTQKSGDTWSAALDCLAKLDKYAYQTQITISTHPSTWP